MSKHNVQSLDKLEENMLLPLLLAICISSINTHSTNDDPEKASADCILPPQPRNGCYVLIEPEIEATPGTRLNNYTLEVKCDPGYHNSERAVQVCTDGKPWWPMTECLPYCNETTPEVISCGLGVSGEETKCLMPMKLSDANLRSGSPLQSFPSKSSPAEILDCGEKPLQFASVIAGGRTAVTAELPWHVAIYTKTTQPYMQICGGSLVSQTVVISAAHCFWSDVKKQHPASDYAVAAGKLYRPWNDQHDEKAQKSDVSEIRIPPRFQGSAANLQDDIALVIVTTPFVYTSAVKPVCLDFDRTLDGKQLTPGNYGQVAGWGLTSENGRESPVLKVVDMPVVAIDECIDKSDPAFRAYITSDKFCAGYQNGTAVCRGDSGGGLSFVELVGDRIRYFLRGVVSAAPRSEGLCNTLAWATFTHVFRHEHFIM